MTIFLETAENLVSQATKMLDGAISSLKLYSPDSNDEFSPCLSMRNKRKYIYLLSPLLFSSSLLFSPFLIFVYPAHVHTALEDFDKHTQSKRSRDITPPLYLIVGSALGFVIAFKYVDIIIIYYSFHY